MIWMLLRKSSLFLYKSAIISIKAVTAAAMAAIGAMGKARPAEKAETAVTAVLNIGAREPMLVISVPRTTSKGPAEAISVPITTIIVCIPIGKEEIQLHSFCIPPVTASMAGEKVSKITPPKTINVFFTALTALLILKLLVCSFSKALSVAPELSRICVRVVLKSSALSPKRIKPALPASALLHKSPKERFCSSAESFNMESTSARLCPSSISSAKLLPVLSFKISDTVVPLFPSSFSMEFM